MSAFNVLTSSAYKTSLLLLEPIVMYKLLANAKTTFKSYILIEVTYLLHEKIYKEDVDDFALYAINLYG